MACWPTAPAPQRRVGRRFVYGLLAFFAVVVLGIGGCVAWFIGTVTAPVDISNDFLAAIDRGAYTEAAALTHPQCGEGLSAEAISAQFAGIDITYDLNSSSITNGNAVVSGSIEIAGADRNIELALRKLGDDWRVCGFRI